MTSENIAGDGRGVLHRGLIRLAHAHPYHAAVLGRCALIADCSARTAAVGLRDFRLALYYNPAFIAGLKLDELIGLLQHLVNHIILGHVDADPAEFCDAYARAIAEEVTANEWVTGSLPGRPIYFADYPMFRPLQSTRERYRYLVTAAFDLEPYADTFEKIPQLDTQKRGADVSNSTAVGTESDPICTKKGLIRTESGVGELRLVDDHGRFCHSDETLSARAVVREVLAEALIESGSAAQESLHPELRSQIERKCRGNNAGLHGVGDESRLDWRRRLQVYVRRHTELRAVLNWPSRRAPQFVGLIPGRRGGPGKARVLAAIDTSGSIGAKLLNAIADELAALVRWHHVVVVECDKEIQAVYPFGGRIETVRGGGGTDFQPVLDPQFYSAHRPDVIIYFTDGAGPAPAVAPDCPILWCLAGGGPSPAKYGAVVRL